MFAVSHQNTYAGLALGCALFATVTDVRDRKIPNALTGAAVIMGVLVHLAWDGWGGLGSSVEAGLLSGVLFLALYIAGGIGAGDVKLMAAIGFLNGLPSLELVLLGTAISGGLFAIAVSVHKGNLSQSMSRMGALLHIGEAQRTQAAGADALKGAEALSIPYAIPIAAGCLLNFLGPIR